MQNVLSASNLYSGLIDAGNKEEARLHHISHEKSFISKQVLFHSESVSLAFENKGFRVFAQAFSASLSVESSVSNAEQYRAFSEFELPSPSEVANKILGFIGNRLQSEVNAGASQDKINDLLSQAREGVKKGFEMARDDIESLGLMNDELGAEIDNSFNLVNGGLDRLETRFIPNNTSLVKSSGDNDHHGEEEFALKKHPDINHNLVADKNNEFSKQPFPHDHLHTHRLNTSGLSLKAGLYSQINSSFSLTTQDGDIVSISLARVDSDYLQANVSNNTERFFYTSRQLEGFQISVQGSLDESEILAINDLLEQVGKISELFFDGDFQAAFLAALNVGFDGSEIAEFSLNLSKIQIDEVRIYGDSNSGFSDRVLTRNQPLIEMVNRLGQTVNLLKQFGSQQLEFRELILEFIEQHRHSRNEETAVSSFDFSGFITRSVELLTG